MLRTWVIAGVCTYAGMAPAHATPATTSKPRAPGIYPVLVVHELDTDPHAYILACAKIENGKLAKFLSPAACAKVVGAPNVELVGADGKRTAVTLGKRGKDLPCPGDDGRPKQPWLAVKGLPAQSGKNRLVLPSDVALDTNAVDPAAFRAIKRKGKFAAMPVPGKGSPASVRVIGQVDLDGDGVLEVITSNLGSVRLFLADGTLVGEVGCEFG